MKTKKQKKIKKNEFFYPCYDMQLQYRSLKLVKLNNEDFSRDLNISVKQNKQKFDV